MSGFQTAGAGANQQWLNQGAANGAAPMAVSHPAAVAEYNQFFGSGPTTFPQPGVFPFVPTGGVAAPGWQPQTVKTDMQAAAARQRASARQQAKRAARAKQPAHDDDVSDSEDEGLDGDDGDEDAMVPEVEGKPKGGKRKSGSDNDKDHKRLKRLLRNRVSAQQARERRKVYVANIETRAKELEDKCAVLEQRVQTLERENFVLRQVLKSSMASAPVFPPEQQQPAADVHQVVPNDAEVPDMAANE